MKILFIVRSIGYGGASKQLAMTANAMARYGHKVFIYSYNWNNLLQDLENVIYIPENKIIKGLPLKEYIYSIYRIRKQIKSLHPDVVITWRVNAGFLGRIASIGMRVKVIFSERTDPYMESSMALNIAKFFCAFSDGAVFQTLMARDYYKRIASKSVIIPNPFIYVGELPKIIDYKKRNKEIAFVGRFFLRQKRQDLALMSFDIIHKYLPDYKLVFYGSDFDFEKVKQMAKTMPIKDDIVFKGAVGNVIEYIRKSKLVMMASDYEGIPNVILESFAAGTPVVSTDCSPGGARILIDNGKNGYIVKRGDVKNIAMKALFVINHSNVAKSFIKNGREKLEEFHSEKIFSEWNKYILKFKK